MSFHFGRLFLISDKIIFLIFFLQINVAAALQILLTVGICYGMTLAYHQKIILNFKDDEPI
jgi:hypothetical protein